MKSRYLNANDYINRLSLEQITLLCWLAAGKRIEICTEVCPDLGTVAELENYPGHFNRRCVYRLKREGLTKEHESYHSGLRWTQITLNDKGHRIANALAKQEGDSHA